MKKSFVCKNIFSALICCLLLVCGYFTAIYAVGPVSATVCAEDEIEIVDSGSYDSDRISWTLDSNGLLTIKGTGSMNYVRPDGTTYRKTFYNSNIVKAVIESGITEISDNIFSNCESLKEVELPDTLESIPDNAFTNSGIETITIPSSVKTIGRYAFAYTDQLNFVDIGDGVDTILSHAFEESAVETLILGEGLKYICDCAFYECDNLIEVTLPEDLEELYESCFEKCSSLKRVVVSPNITFYGYYIFCGCESLEDVVISNGTKELGEWMFYGCSALKDISFPDSLQTIGEVCFGYCESLQNVDLNKVKKIDYDAFTDCYSLKSLYIPKSVKTIRDTAFGNCCNIYFTVDPNNAYFASKSGGLFNKKMTKLIRIAGTTSFKIPNSVVTMGYDAIDGSTNLKFLYYGKKLDTSMRGFDECPNLTKFDISAKKISKVKAVSKKKKTVKLTWSEIKSIDGYQIYRSTKKKSGYKLIKTIKKASKTTYTDKKVKKGKKYYYKIRPYVKLSVSNVVNNEWVYKTYNVKAPFSTPVKCKVKK